MVRFYGCNLCTPTAKRPAGALPGERTFSCGLRASRNRKSWHRIGWLETVCCVLLLSTVATACAGGRSQPNVLLIVTDDQRPDTIHALGNAIIETPNLDQLVRAGTVFTRAVSPNPICTPSRAEIITGCSGFRNGVIDFGKVINPALTTWPQAMRAAGYSTWYVGKWHNNGRPSTHGYEAARGLFSGGGGKWWKDQVDCHGRPVTGYRGWVFQQDDGKKFPELGVGLTPDISRRFADAAIEIIRQRHDRPFFIHLNFTSPHDPLLIPPGYANRYDPTRIPLPPNFRPEHPFDHGNLRGRDEQLLPWPRTPDIVRADLAAYYAVISYMDQQLGRIIATLRETGQWNNTLLVFTSDHGLAMGSHGLRGKQNMYEHTIGVPLIFVGPRVPRSQRRSAQIYLRDLYPTVCELAGVPIPPTVTGCSGAAVVRGTQAELHTQVFCYFRDVQRMVRTHDWKLIHYPRIDRWQLFHIAEDPTEQHDLSADPRYTAQRGQLRQVLRRLQRQYGDTSAGTETP